MEFVSDNRRSLASPIPLSTNGIIHTTLYGNPISTFCKWSIRNNAEQISICIRARSYIEVFEQQCARHTGIVIIEPYICQIAGTGSRIRTKNINFVDRPGFTSRNYKVISTFSIIGIERSFKVLTTSSTICSYVIHLTPKSIRWWNCRSIPGCITQVIYKQVCRRI